MTTQELDALQALCDEGEPTTATVLVMLNAIPSLIVDSQKLTAENAFLRKAYREKAALNRLMAAANELAATNAEGPYKDYFDRVTALPDCNTCGRKHCKHRPRWGEQIRINCPLWRGPQPTDEPNA